MPKGKPINRQDIGSLGEQLLGRGDDKRSTKTFIEDGSLAMSLGIFQGLPDMIMNIGRRLHAEETGMDWQDVTVEEIFEKYPEAKEIMVLHQRIVEHKGSQAGYLVDRFTSSERRESMETKEDSKRSSGEVNSPKKWE